MQFYTNRRTYFPDISLVRTQRVHVAGPTQTVRSTGYAIKFRDINNDIHEIALPKRRDQGFLRRVNQVNEALRKASITRKKKDSLRRLFAKYLRNGRMSS